jgi:succinate dehydrogenase/fumarate reductase flavoprotein subunit
VQQFDQSSDVYDAVIIGGGLAGLSAALTLLDRGGRVAVLEKMGHLGGNSAWASSGVNAVDLENNVSGDSVAAFTSDTLKGAQLASNPLVNVLTEGSVGSLTWLRERLQEHLKLDLVGQLGGHSYPRTHRPSTGLAGSSIIFAIEKQLNKYLTEANPRLTMMKWTRATKLVTNSDGAVVGVEYEQVKGGKDNGTLHASNVVIATGGYASDYTEDSLLKQFRPDLLRCVLCLCMCVYVCMYACMYVCMYVCMSQCWYHTEGSLVKQCRLDLLRWFSLSHCTDLYVHTEYTHTNNDTCIYRYATTNTKGTTGDGHKMAIAVGAKKVDLEDVQVRCIYIYIYIYIYTHIHIYIYMLAYIYVYMYVYIHMPLYVCLFVYTYIRLYMHT